MGRSGGFNLGGTYSSLRSQQQQQHASSVSNSGLSFSNVNNQDPLHLHGSDVFPSSHSSYHQQVHYLYALFSSYLFYFICLSLYIFRVVWAGYRGEIWVTFTSHEELIEALLCWRLANKILKICFPFLCFYLEFVSLLISYLGGVGGELRLVYVCCQVLVVIC